MSQTSNYNLPLLTDSDDTKNVKETIKSLMWDETGSAMNVIDSAMKEISDEVDTKAAAVHTHTSSDVTDFASAVTGNTAVSANTTARHTHSNKTTLDAITAAYTTAEKTKLSGIATGAQVNTVTSVVGRTGAVTLSASDVSGLADVATSGAYSDLSGVPTALSAFTADSTHRLVTDTEKSAWNGKQSAITASGVLKGAGSGNVSAATRGTDYSLVNAPVTVTFAAASWVQNSTTGAYEQSVAVAGLLTTDDKRTRVESVGSTDPAAQALTDEAYALVDYVACTTAGYLYARCPDGAPEVDFQVAVVIAR